MDKFGKPFEEVHTYMDSFHGEYGGRHRFKNHHKEGIERVRSLYGDEAAKAAESHVLLDCGHVPSEDDYKTKKVDWLGCKESRYTIVDKRIGLVVPKF